MKTRLIVISEAIKQPSDAWLAGRMIAWALALPPLTRLVSISALTSRLWSKRVTQARAGHVERVVHLTRAIYGARRPLRDNCLSRSLLTYRFLAKAGADPRLVVGVRRGADYLDGHVWVVLGGSPVHECADSVEGFRKVLVFGPRGRPESPDDPPVL
ncbi:MAG: lasso peptide biosynthesis B2 protein [Actinobacteria bacterium]|nr:lasso peptide biosynthesis B2 protein [Actinomycetota bacterium]